MHTLVVKYEDDPPGVVFTFFDSGDRVWGWVPRDKLEALAGKTLGVDGCIATYHIYRELIQGAILRKRSQEESPKKVSLRKLLKNLLMIGRIRRNEYPLQE